MEKHSIEKIKISKDQHKAKKNIPYFQYLTDSFNTVWKNKAIILITLIFAFFGGTTNFNPKFNTNTSSFSNFSNYEKENPDYKDLYYNEDPQPFENVEEYVGKASNKFQDIQNESWFVPIAVGVGCIALIYFLAGIYFRTVIRGSLIKIEKLNREEKALTFRNLWRSGTKSMADIALIWLTLIPITILYLILSFPLMCCICIGWIVLLILSFFVRYLATFMYRYKVLTNATVGESITMPFKLMTENFSEIITYILFTFAVNIGQSILVFIALVPILIVIIISIIAGLWILLAISGLFILIEILLLSSILIPTIEIFHTKVFLDLIATEPNV